MFFICINREYEKVFIDLVKNFFKIQTYFTPTVFFIMVRIANMTYLMYILRARLRTVLLTFMYVGENHPLTEVAKKITDMAKKMIDEVNFNHFFHKPIVYFYEFFISAFIQKQEEITQIEKDINPLLSDDPQVIQSSHTILCANVAIFHT